MDAFPEQEPKSKALLVTLIPAPQKDDKGITYTDQTGKFPFSSSRGHNYIMVLYDYDVNCILVNAIKDRTSTTLIESWQHLHHRLTKNGHTTNTYIIDNECSANLKAAFQDAELSFQLVPPGQHQRNTAERGIRVFKNHFLL